MSSTMGSISPNPQLVSKQEETFIRGVTGLSVTLQQLETWSQPRSCSLCTHQGQEAPLATRHSRLRPIQQKPQGQGMRGVEEWQEQSHRGRLRL